VSKVISRKFTTILAGLVTQRATDRRNYRKPAAQEESTGMKMIGAHLAELVLVAHDSTWRAVRACGSQSAAVVAAASRGLASRSSTTPWFSQGFPRSGVRIVR
jgi:hypothetical protein